MIIRVYSWLFMLRKKENMNTHEYTRIHKNIIDDNSWVICDNSCWEKKKTRIAMNYSWISHKFFCTRIYMNKHEYTKILLMIIRGLFTIIHVEKESSCWEKGYSKN